MVFSSKIFLFVFLPALLMVYYLPVFKKSNTILGRKYKNTVLLLASLFFYWWGEPVFFLLMCFSIVVNWLFGLMIDRHRAKTKLFVILSCIYNLGILFVYKYLTFFTENIALLAGDDSIVVKIAIPIGISFFTFQMMSYVFDVARKKAECQKNILDVALYIMMFPQLIAGPIVRYETVANEISNRNENLTDFSEGVNRFIKGLAKKVLLANQLAPLVDLIFDSPIKGTTVAVAWLGLIARALQVYYDFSGYSDMAIGLGRMFGFHFLENFNFPYMASSISDFWTRWHISMGTWFRDYVYFPLGGSRVSKMKLFRNLLIVWLLTGLWHGANWTHVVWGLSMFVFIAIEKFTGFDKKIPKWLGHIYTLVLVFIFPTLFVRADSLSYAVDYIRHMFGLAGNAFVNSDVLNLGCSFIVFLVFGVLFCFPIETKIESWSESPAIPLRILYSAIMTVLLLLSIVFVIKSGYNPFIYFNF